MPDTPDQLLRAARHKRGLSVGDVARAAGVLAATVHRLEHGGIAPLEEVVKIAEALDYRPDELFPAAFQHLRAIGDPKLIEDAAWNDSAFRKRMAEAGVDVHPADWTLKLQFRGGAHRFPQVLGHDVDRFWRALDGDLNAEPTFFAFDGVDASAVVNLRELVHAHAMFDPPGFRRRREQTESIEVLLAGERRWLKFGSVPDEPEDPDDPGSFQGQLHELLMELEVFGASQTVSFFDEDGERAVFRVDAIAMFIVPHWLLWGYFDNDESEVPPPPPRSRRARKPRLKVVRGGG